MTALFNPSPLVLGTLQNLSLILGRSTVLARGPGVSGLAVGRSEARAFGGLDMAIHRGGHSKPAKLRYGAITIAPRAQGSAYSKSPGVHPAIDRAYDNPGVRFGDRVRGGERPISAAGETSCHFSQTSVSKTSPIREMINVRLIVQELKAWIAAPGRPLNTVKRYSDEPLQALDDPRRIARQEAMKSALEHGFREAAERDAPRILEAIRQSVDQQVGTAAPVESRSTGSDDRAIRQPGRDVATAGPAATNGEATACPEPTAGRTEPTPVRYTPGRPENAGEPAPRAGFRERPQNPLLEANLVGQARSRGAPSQREMVQVPPSKGPAAGRPTAEPSPSSREMITGEEPAAHRRDQVTNPTSPQASPAPTDAGRACLATTDGAHAETQASSPPNPNAGMVRATQAGTEARETEAAPAPSQARDPRPMSSPQVRAARASATPPQPGPAATRPNTPVDTPARHVQASELVAAPTPAPPAGTPVRNSDDSRAADPAPVPSDTCTAAAPTTPPAMAGARPTAHRGTGQQSEWTSAGPDIAAIMDARDRTALTVPKPPVEPDKHPTKQKSTEPQPEIRIIGAKRPAKRRVSRDRGRER